MGVFSRPCACQKTRVSIISFLIALGGMGHGLFAATMTEPASSTRGMNPQVRSVALFYGTPLPVEALSRFDWVVVEPGNVDASELEALRRARVRVFAYLSVGEARRDQSIDPNWVLSTADRWDPFVIAPAARRCG